MQPGSSISFSCRARGSFDGFSVVELLIVLLLVGVLASVALPRLLGSASTSTDSALRHFAGRLEAAAAVYHASWQAQGRPAADTALEAYAGLRANAAGYPQGFDTDGGTEQGLATADDCQAIVQGLLGSRGPKVTAVPGVEDLSNVSTGLAVLVELPYCQFFAAPVAQARQLPKEVGFIEYNSRTGRASYRRRMLGRS